MQKYFVGTVAHLLLALLSTPNQAAAPIGGVTSVSNNTIYGWACDTDTPANSVQIHFYIDAPWSKYKGGNDYSDHFAGDAIANTINGAQSISCQNDAHGFEFSIPQSIRSRVGPGKHMVFIYALDTSGVGPNPLIQTQEITIIGTKASIDSWFQNFSSDCKKWKIKNWPIGGQMTYQFSTASGCADEYPDNYPSWDKYWVLESTNETHSFGPVFDTNTTAFNFTPDGQLWNFGFNQKSTGGYSIGWVIDKINYLPAKMKNDTYSGAFFERELGGWITPLATNNVFIEFDIKINASDQAMLLNDSSSMDYGGASGRGMLLARNRTAIGFVADSAGTTRFVEVNLFETTNFDLCTTSTMVENTSIPCESASGSPGGYDNTIGLFDRRSSFGGGQITYYDISQLHRVFGPAQPLIIPDSQWHHVRIPVTGLFRDAPWTDITSMKKINGVIDLSGMSLRAFYIGHEIWGRGRLWADFSNFEIYNFVAN